MPGERILVVGCGLSGVVVARQLAEAGFSVHIIDKRNHLGGNCFDYEGADGIRIHKYGPHIFHTSNSKVVSWLSQYTDWVEYEHKVKALLQDGNFVPFPPNQETLNLVGEAKIIDTFYRPYSKKMWGLDIEQIDDKILARVPIREGLEDRYFPKDSFQAFPKQGYSHLISNIIGHESISVQLGCQFDKSMESDYFHIFNSMPIDEYYGFRFGELPYRSLRFHIRKHDRNSVFPAAVVNFTDEGRYTRVTEWKKFPNHGANTSLSVVTYEEPCDYRENHFERYYPVKDKAGSNRVRYKKYADLTRDSMTFIGRCGLYVYIDMDQAVASSLAISRDFLDKYEKSAE